MNNYVNFRKSTIRDFKQDYGRLSIVCKMLQKWKEGKTDSIHLIVNHIIILINVFDTAAAILLFNSDSTIWSELKTILLFLNRLPVVIPELDINTLEIPINTKLMEILDQL